MLNRHYHCHASNIGHIRERRFSGGLLRYPGAPDAIWGKRPLDRGFLGLLNTLVRLAYAGFTVFKTCAWYYLRSLETQTACVRSASALYSSASRVWCCCVCGTRCARCLCRTWLCAGSSVSRHLSQGTPASSACLYARSSVSLRSLFRSVTSV